MPDIIRHRDTFGEYAEMALDNAFDDMHDDGVDDRWIAQISDNAGMILNLVNLRHSLECDRMDEPTACAECGDEADGMHPLTCILSPNDEKCRNLIDSLIYGDFIRPRPI